MKDDRYYLEVALEQAEKAAKEGTYPIGAVLVGPTGEILAKGHNSVWTNMDPTGHAEMNVIRSAGKWLMDSNYKNKCTIYSTVEPCPMCTGALILADIHRSVWALSDDYLGAMRKAKAGADFRRKYDRIEVCAMPYKDLAIKSQELMRTWEERRGNHYQLSHIE